MATNQPDLLQKFIDNEKKSKTWTIISVLVFIVLGGIIIYQASKLKQNENRLKENEKQLYIALDRANSLNDTLEGQKISLENSTSRIAVLERERDSLLAKINATVIPPVAVVKSIVYIQYMDTYRRTSDSILSLLKRNRYNAPGAENIKKGSFSSSIRYFNDSDKPAAERLASLINTNIGRYRKNNIRIQKTNLSVPKGQLEVWLGEYKRINPVEQVRKYSVQQKAQK